MKLHQWVDFFFIGEAVLPATLAWEGHLDLAVLVLVPLLFIACGLSALAAGPEGLPVRGTDSRADSGADLEK
ncbi:MAG: hypothetical protein ACREUW_22010 [Burkholderiales bacterium]